ncbi:hypothetical protein RRG08_006992 [Elysia crispata]|uniref:Uncharacterized protein n=1 Tax=Elysia crispata TaxID=231223 RepID=A0AAE1A6L0_9GAST|nr:hypothetical protein RRG08_006992 [Elysia crispata]
MQSGDRSLLNTSICDKRSVSFNHRGPAIRARHCTVTEETFPTSPLPPKPSGAPLLQTFFCLPFCTQVGPSLVSPSPLATYKEVLVSFLAAGRPIGTISKRPAKRGNKF